MPENQSDTIETIFLCQSCQTGESVAQRLTLFLKQARRTIDFCAYSFHFCDREKEIVVAALEERHRAGVAIRIAYDAGNAKAMYEPGQGYDSCLDEGGSGEPTTPEFVNSLPFPSRAIEGERVLMHQKYVVIDAGTAEGQVWTGSTNFTDESWTLQENNIIILRSPEVADLYANDFEDLWKDSHVDSDGIGDSGEATLVYEGQPAHVLVNFSPGEGEWMDEMIARQVERTREHATLAFVVLTSGRILSALLSLMERGVKLEGVFDLSQMEGVKYQWSTLPQNKWKIPAFERLVSYGNLVGKSSTPYSPTSKHDYMHNKIMVLDDTVITGSYNFSRHAQRNSENLLIITSPLLAADYRRYISGLIERYGARVERGAP